MVADDDRHVAVQFSASVPDEQVIQAMVEPRVDVDGDVGAVFPEDKVSRGARPEQKQKKRRSKEQVILRYRKAHSAVRLDTLELKHATPKRNMGWDRYTIRWGSTSISITIYDAYHRTAVL